MKGVELYAQVRYLVQIEGLSRREAARRYGIDPRTVAKMLAFSVPPRYRRSRSHAHILKDEDWKGGVANYQVRIGDRWYTIEDWQMLKPVEPNPTGNAILWYNDIAGSFLIYCFTPSRET